MAEQTSKSRGVKPALMLVLGLLASIVTFAAGTSVASAHHSEISASVNCAGTVSYTAVSWEPGTDGGTNNRVRVWYVRSDEGDSIQHDLTQPYGAYDASTNYRITGSFAWPAADDATITLYAEEQANWGANEDGPGPSYRSSTSVTRPTDCIPETPVPPTVAFTPTCADALGAVQISFTNGGSSPVSLTVLIDGVPQPAVDVPAGTTAPGISVTYGSLTNNVSHTIVVKNGQTDVGSTTYTPACATGTGTAAPSATCADFNGTVTITLTNTGGNTPVVFVVDGVTYTIANGDAPQTVTFTNVPDGSFTKTVTINGVDTIVSIEVRCDAVLTGSAVCNEVDVDNVITAYGYTITNPGSSAVPVTWVDGSATVPAGGSVTVKSASTPLVVKSGGTTATTIAANDDVCSTSVTFTKQLAGQPATGETYTVRVSRLVAPNYVTYLTFDLAVGAPLQFDLPSTIDGTGITYRVEEIEDGTAAIHTISPDSFTLQGNLGETVSVVVTNSYASVQIDKQVSAAVVKGGEQLTYTLVATNTGGLTLNPVVISDSLPPNVSMVSALVAGGNGTCELTKSTRPQLVWCELNGALPVGASTPVVTIVALVDADTAVDTSIVNQAKVLGSYTPNDRTTELARLKTQATGGQLSCVPVLEGTVCDLSAQVSTVVQAAASAPPVAPPSTPVVAQAPPVLTSPSRSQLPVTGTNGVDGMLTIALALLALGGVAVIARRRRPTAD